MQQQILLLEAAVGIGLETMLAVAAMTRSFLRSGQASQVLGGVAGRTQAEDVKTSVDEEAHRLYQQMAEKFRALLNVSLGFYSEHGIEPADPPSWSLVVDPIGGTTYIRYGHQEAVWTVWTLYDGGQRPMVGGAMDVRHGEILLASPGGVRLTSLEWATPELGVNTLLTPSSRTEIDTNTSISAYLGDFAYAKPFMDLFGPLVSRATDRDQEPEIRPFAWHAGGESTGPYLARGENGGVHLYVSVHEPRTEIDCWLAIPHVMPELFVGSVQEDGTLVPYEGFVPTQYESGRVPIFIAAVNEQLAANAVRWMSQEQIQEIHAAFRRRYGS